MKFVKIFIYFVVASLFGCVQPAYHASNQVPLVDIPSRQQNSSRLTLGTFQMHVHKGAYGGELIAKLGSPNTVIKNSSTAGETWVYDKVSSERETATDGYNTVAVSSSKTLTVVIKFDTNQRVVDYAYHSSSF